MRSPQDTFSLHFLSEILLLSFSADLSTVMGKGKEAGKARRNQAADVLARLLIKEVTAAF
jgi:hypothetical protein